MVTRILERPIKEEQEERIIRSQYWELPESLVDNWRPYSACLNYQLFWGPSIYHRHGISLQKNMVAYWHGPRGGLKTLSMSYYNAKLLRMGKPVWTNYPISFYVQEIDDDDVTGKEPRNYLQIGPCQWINLDGTFSYYESMPLDMNKFYNFSTEIRKGGVSIDELQYFVEARTSGKYQNRVLSYQIMQIRKTANSFYYTVQNPRWVDNRFGWSADFNCESYDVAKLSYDRRNLGRELEEGELGRQWFQDISGILTGQPFSKTNRTIGPYQFRGKYFWNIYPTNFVIDIFEAQKGPDRDQAEKKAKKAKDDALSLAIEEILNERLANNQVSMLGLELGEELKTRGIEVNAYSIGRYLSSLGIERRQNWKGKTTYHFGHLAEAVEEEKK